MNIHPVTLGFVLAVLAAVLALFIALALIPFTAQYVGGILLLLALSRLC